MARIGLDLRFYRRSTGGLSRYSRNLLKELLAIDKENHYTAIITPEDEAEFDARGRNLQKLVVPIPHYSLAEQTKLPRVLKDQNFDLVHFTNFNHPILYRQPFVVTIHDLIMHLYPSGEQKKSPLRRLVYKLVVRDCKRAQRIIVPSQATKNDLVKLFKLPPEKIIVTHEGSEDIFCKHTEREKIAVKERLKLPERYLLFVSRWEPYKGLPQLLRAYENLIKDDPNLGLVICGKPEERNPEVTRLVEQAKQRHPNIVTPGFVSDENLAAIYAAAAAFVHVSLYEGFGIMILEAFASGAPVIASNTSSLPEVVGKAGLLVDPQDTDGLTAAIKKVLTDSKLAEELRQKGFERVKQYSWRRMAEETLEVYRSP